MVEQMVNLQEKVGTISLTLNNFQKKDDQLRTSNYSVVEIDDEVDAK